MIEHQKNQACYLERKAGKIILIHGKVSISASLPESKSSAPIAAVERQKKNTINL